MPTDITIIVDTVSRLGLGGAAILLIYALLTERIIPAARLDEMRRERAENREHAREAMEKNIAEVVLLSKRIEDLERSQRELIEEIRYRRR